jgi:hypothetical protein
MNPDPPKVLADMSISGFLKGNAWIEPFNCLAVVDSKGIFLGMISREKLSEFNHKKKTPDKQAKETSLALGNLYQIGLLSIFRTVTDIISDYESK